MLSQSHQLARSRPKALAARYIAPAVVAAVALLASACSTEEPPAPPAAEETATTITAAPDVAPAEPEAAPEPKAAPADFIVPDEAPADPSAEVAEQVIEAAEAAAPESELTLGDCTDWVADPEITLDEQQSTECTAMLTAAVEECEELECFPEHDAEPEQPAAPATTVAPEVQPAEHDAEPEQPATPATTVAPEVQPAEHDAEPEQPATPATTVAPEAEASEEPEPPIVSVPATSLIADPIVVSEGLNTLTTFTVTGSGFDPSLAIWLLLCALPGDSLSVDTPADQLAAAMESVDASQCDLGSAQAVNVDSEGSFTATRDAIVIANFMWVASDQAETQVAGAAVFLETPEPVARISEPLRRCAPPGSRGATRVSVLTGTTAEGFYEPVVEGGEGSCEQIVSWWEQVTHAEAQRIADGHYPCEYQAAYNYWPLTARVNGPAMLVGCWPRLLHSGVAVDDPEEEAARLLHVEGHSVMPPNHPALVEALYDCYRESLEGPPPDWASPAGGFWVPVPRCNGLLTAYGNPVRYFRVTPECAAKQYADRIEERKARGTLSGGPDIGYQGDFSWSNCPTRASRLLAEGLDTYAERCEAVIDASVGSDTDRTAEGHGLSRSEYVAAIKAMYCDGTKDTLRSYPQFGGEWVASWLPREPAVCFEAAMLVAAHRAATGRWARVGAC